MKPSGDVRLRDVVPDDLPIFFEQQRDPEANTMAAFPARERAAFAEHWAKVLADDSVSKKTILFDGQVVGNMLEKCGFAVAGEESAASSAGDDEVEEFVMRLGAP